jgi:predicted transporter
MGLHVIMALLLLGVGIYTSKKWNCGVDVSHKTFLVISLPCPVCLAALFMSIMLLSNTVEISSALLGLGVGVIFFASIISSSLVVRRLKKDPTTLGNAMTFLGLFYLMGAVIAPAYMHAKQMGLPDFSGPDFDIIPFIGFAILISMGFALNRIKTQH